MVSDLQKETNKQLSGVADRNRQPRAQNTRKDSGARHRTLDRAPESRRVLRNGPSRRYATPIFGNGRNGPRFHHCKNGFVRKGAQPPRGWWWNGIRSQRRA